MDKNLLDELNELLEGHLINVFQEDETCKDRLAIVKIQKQCREIIDKVHKFDKKIFHGVAQKLSDDPNSNLSKEETEKLERQLNYLEQINKLLEDLDNV